MRQDLHDRLFCMYDTDTASVNAEPPPPHAATKPITRTPPTQPSRPLTPSPPVDSATPPKENMRSKSLMRTPLPVQREHEVAIPHEDPPPVPIRLACVLLQPWPPPVFMILYQPLSQEPTAPCLKAPRGGGR